MKTEDKELLIKDINARFPFGEQKRDYSLGDEQYNVDWLNENQFDHRELIGIGVGTRRYRTEDLIISYF